MIKNTRTYLKPFMTDALKKLDKKSKTRLYYMLESIATLETKVSERELRRMIYNAGVYLFRQYHGAGSPASLLRPGLKAPKRVFSHEAGRFVHEEVAKYLKEEEAAAAAG